jgi:DNA-binding MarR family transcriptional regulator
MADGPRTIINETLLQMAENLPLFEKITLSKGPLGSLTTQEVHTISLIGKMGSPRMSELARRGHVTLGTMTVMIAKLVKKGYVVRMRDDEDRRVVRVGLTRVGKKADALHQEFHGQMMERVLGVLTISEQRQLAKLIRKIVASLG